MKVFLSLLSCMGPLTEGHQACGCFILVIAKEDISIETEVEVEAVASVENISTETTTVAEPTIKQETYNAYKNKKSLSATAKRVQIQKLRKSLCSPLPKSTRTI